MRVFLLLGLVAGLAFGQRQAPHEADKAVPWDGPTSEEYIGNPEAIAAGGENYLLVCSGCHGATGEGGRGPNLITGRNIRRASDAELFDSIKNGIPGSDMPPSPLPDEQIWQLAAFVRSLSAPAFEQNVEGDPEAGKTVYYAKAKCNGCHMIRGEGGYLGPDLSTIGTRANINSIREGVVEPNKRFSEGFRPVEVTLADGTKIKGSAKNNSNYSLQVMENSGKLHLLQKQKVKEANFQEKSWMPADYAERLTEDEMRDLLAFLSRQAVGGAAKKR